ncbi:MAG: sulfatase-like hydrolase/transferase, partial [Candidatus Paceibacteria bacterium]
MLKERVPLKVRQRIPRWAKSPVRRARDKLVHPIQNKLKYRQRLSDVPEITLGEKNVLIVTVDCLRADHTTLLNYERNTTPFIGDLGLRFPNAVSASPWTYPSVVSILTGYYPHNHGGTFSTEPRHFREGYPNAIKENVYTLSELFGRAGYSTYLSTTIYPAQLPLNGRFSKLKMWDYRTPADELISSLLRWWRSHSDKKFAYLHLGDLHEPLRLPELDQYPFGRIADISGLDGWRFTNTTEPTAKFQKYREEKIRLYDTLIHYLDGQIKRLFRGLEREGDIDDTLLIITGDHGEEFGRHNPFHHASPLSPMTQLPIIV